MNSSDQRWRRSLVDDLQSLLQTQNRSRLLREEARKGPYPAQRGYAENNNMPQWGQAGIASPLTEGSPAETPGLQPKWEREHYDPMKVVWSSDGIFAWEYRELERIKLRDANRNLVEFVLAQEPEESE